MIIWLWFLLLLLFLSLIVDLFLAFFLVFLISFMSWEDTLASLLFKILELFSVFRFCIPNLMVLFILLVVVVGTRSQLSILFFLFLFIFFKPNLFLSLPSLLSFNIVEFIFDTFNKFLFLISDIKEVSFLFVLKLFLSIECAPSNLLFFLPFLFIFFLGTTNCWWCNKVSKFDDSISFSFFSLSLFSILLPPFCSRTSGVPCSKGGKSLSITVYKESEIDLLISFSSKIYFSLGI